MTCNDAKQHAVRLEPAGQLHEHPQRHGAGRPGDQPVARRGQPGPAGQHRLASGLDPARRRCRCPTSPTPTTTPPRRRCRTTGCTPQRSDCLASDPTIPDGTVVGDRPAGRHHGRPQDRRDRVRGRLDVDHALSVSERRRIRVAVLGGGRSSEHEVSLRSAASVVAALDPERFDVVPVQIDRGGAWQIESSAQLALEPGNADRVIARLSLEPGAESRSLVPRRRPVCPPGGDRPDRRGAADPARPVRRGRHGCRGCWT